MSDESRSSAPKRPIAAQEAQGAQIAESSERIAGLLVEREMVSREQVEEARGQAGRHGGDLVAALAALGYVDIDDFLDLLRTEAPRHGLDISPYAIEPGLAHLLPASTAREHRILPIAKEDGILRIAVARPLGERVIALLEDQTQCAVRPIICNMDDLDKAIGTCYAGLEKNKPAPVKLKIIAHLLRSLDAFPALPETVTRVRDAMTNPNSSMEDVAQIITMDPPIAAKVLSVANSPAYGFRRQIEDLKLALSLLGLREAYSIVLSAAVLNVVEKMQHFDYKRYWLDAVCCAAATRFVARAAGLADRPAAFAAGLLHDIGKAALAEVAPGLYAKVPPNPPVQRLTEAEEQATGISHTEAGYELALHWDLPEEIAVAIRLHHRPEQASKARETVALVAVADRLAHAMGTKLEHNEGLFDGLEQTLDFLEIDAEQAEALIDQFVANRDGDLGKATES